MEVREARTTDGEAIRRVARRSMEASYTLGPGTIESAVAEWYGGDALGDKLDRSDVLVLVAERHAEDSPGIVGFAESALGDGNEADVRWIHTDPDYRGRGVGSRLLERTRQALAERGVEHLRGTVLADNADGNAFYRDRGFEKAAEDRVEIDGRQYVENVYVEREPEGLTAVATADGREVYVDRDATERGSVGPFYAVYSDPDRESRYGFYCGNCDSLANAMDAMGRIECNDCGNTRRPTRWDAAYL